MREEGGRAGAGRAGARSGAPSTAKAKRWRSGCSPCAGAWGGDVLNVIADRCRRGVQSGCPFGRRKYPAGGYISQQGLHGRRGVRNDANAPAECFWGEGATIRPEGNVPAIDPLPYPSRLIRVGGYSDTAETVSESTSHVWIA